MTWPSTPEHQTQTLTCHDLNPDTAYIPHYIYSYLTQGQPEQGLIAMSPQAKHIISKGIGVYATPVLQPTTPVARLTTDLAIYAYLLRKFIVISTLCLCLSCCSLLVYGFLLLVFEDENVLVAGIQSIQDSPSQR